MKAELVDVTETRKRLAIELPAEVVDAEIERVTAAIGRSAKIPGFRPGKVPVRVVRQRFKEDILHQVARGLVPPSVDEALREQDLEPVDTPDVQDVVVEEGKPLTFTAVFEVVPEFDPGDYRGIGLRKKSAVLERAAVDEALERLRQRAARFEPVEGRALAAGDWATVDLERQVLGGAEKPPREAHENVTIELGAAANPPGFDDELVGLEVGARKAFTVRYPADHAAAELAGAEVEYAVTLKGVKQRVVPALDDEFAKDLGSFETLADLSERVRHDLQHEANHEADRELRSDLLADLSRRVTFPVPDALLEQELDRRIDEFARRLIEQQVDPRQAGIDWKQLREGQRDAAIETVKATVALDEIAKREAIEVSDDDLDREVRQFAERGGRAVTAVRAQLEKDNSLGRLRGGMRREKTIEFLLANASITAASDEA